LLRVQHSEELKMWFLINDNWCRIDVMLPLDDGFVLKTIKREFRLNGTPIVAIARRKTRTWNPGYDDARDD
jgi:hypothetical protein